MFPEQREQGISCHSSHSSFNTVHSHRFHVSSSSHTKPFIWPIL